MNLCEEYFLRHGINIKWAKHVNRGVLFHRIEVENRIFWHVLDITYQQDSSHPGKYLVELLSPVHDALSQGLHSLKGRNMFDRIDAVDVEWDEYEEFWPKWFDKTFERKSSIVKDNLHVFLTAWEIYCYCYDSEMAKFSEQESLHKSLSLSLPPMERLNGCMDILAFLNERNGSLLNVWNKNMIPWMGKYCFWLADMVGQ
jgi:hypothetical protein